MNVRHLALLILCSITSFTAYTKPTKPLNQGVLIAIEGIDGAGKSTLARAVSAALIEHGFDVVLTKEPGDTELGKEIRELVITQTLPMSPRAEFLLFAADRAQHFAEVIIPALEQNKLIISDRLADSSLAYQGYGRDLDLEILKGVNAWATETIVPDLIIYVRIPTETAMVRCRKRGTLSAYEQHKNFLEKTASGFEDLYKNRVNVIVVDGTESQEILHKRVCSAIEQWIKIKNFLY